MHTLYNQSRLVLFQSDKHGSKHRLTQDNMGPSIVKGFTSEFVVRGYAQKWDSLGP
jgi:hypothetical protein